MDHEYGSDKLYLHTYVQKHILQADTWHHLPSLFNGLREHYVIKSHAMWNNTSHCVGEDLKEKGAWQLLSSLNGIAP